MSDLSRKIQVTKNYSLFVRESNENRPFDLKKHKKLIESMKLYGFLRCFPIVTVQQEGGKLKIKDGQHRFGIAQEFGLEVYYVIMRANEDFDAAITSSAGKPWQLRDYALKHAANGLKPYAEGLEFAEQHGLSVGISFALLAGTTSFGNCQEDFIRGTFRIKDRPWADAVASIYGPLTGMAPQVKGSRLVEACMAVCRVKDFDPQRLIDGAKRCREKLVSYSTRDAYLLMMETVYNFGRQRHVGLKAAAENAMRERVAVGKPKDKQKPSEAA